MKTALITLALFCTLLCGCHKDNSPPKPAPIMLNQKLIDYFAPCQGGSEYLFKDKITGKEISSKIPVKYGNLLGYNIYEGNDKPDKQDIYYELPWIDSMNLIVDIVAFGVDSSRVRLYPHASGIWFDMLYVRGAFQVDPSDPGDSVEIIDSIFVYNKYYKDVFLLKSSTSAESYYYAMV